MPIINVEGLGKVEIAGNTPSQEEQQAIMQAMQGATQQDTPNGMGRPFARAARMGVGGLAGTLDLPASAIKAASGLIGSGLSAISDDGPVGQLGGFLSGVSNQPSYRDASVGAMDKATEGTSFSTAPQSTLERGMDFVGEAVAGAGPFGALQKSVGTMMQPNKIVGGFDDMMRATGQAGKNKSLDVATAAEKRALAGQYYDEAEKLGGVLSESASDDLLLQIRTKIPELATDKQANSFVRVLEGAYKGKRLTLKNLEDIDKALGREIYTTKNMNMRGEISGIGRNLKEMQDALRTTMDEVSEAAVVGGKKGWEAFKRGRDLWATASKMDDVERVVYNSQFANRPDLAIRSGVASILKSKTRRQGFKPEEIKALEKVAKGGAVPDMLRTLGSRLMGIGGFMAGGPAGGAVAKGGEFAARGAGEKLALKDINKVMGLLSQRQGGVAPAIPKIGNMGNLFGSTFNKTMQEIQE